MNAYRGNVNYPQTVFSLVRWCYWPGAKLWGKKRSPSGDHCTILGNFYLSKEAGSEPVFLNTHLKRLFKRNLYHFPDDLLAEKVRYKDLSGELDQTFAELTGY
ncbi:hypothetical protein PHET_07949 [Paragonimus heterotremus]|uniref:Uncharacterized protein n=1 Tax=Paragonimus heterotremus TaxID=100268 RepID=A0A8J4SFF3_9TREM|nr:hypothetical protein PHET_07949 [Paragonimus heterotremus]